MGLVDAEGPCGLGGKAIERRERIVAAARALFIEHGFHATGVAQIAKASGVAVGQIYRDFASKEAIIAAIAEADASDYLACDGYACAAFGIDPVADEADAWTWLRGFLDPDPDCSSILMTDILAESARNPKVAAIFETIHHRVRDAILRVVSMLVPATPALEPGCAGERALIADLVMTLSLGLMQQDMLHGEAQSRRLADAGFEMVRMRIMALRDTCAGRARAEASFPAWAMADHA